MDAGRTSKGSDQNIEHARPGNSGRSGIGREPLETYYDPADLAKFGEIGNDAPELAKKFFEYYAEVFKEGELTEREKALIALAVAHTVQCPYCIDAYTRASLEKGSNLAEMTEAVHVAAAIRGGATLAQGVQMRKIAEKLSMRPGD
jgi:alkylhydroperoxidase/carboxymuconolactone decarboxylase family protein